MDGAVRVPVKSICKLNEPTAEVEDNPVSTEIKENIKEVSGISDKESSKNMPDAEWAENRCWVCHMEEQDASDEYRRTKYDPPILVSAANEINWTSW